MFGKSEFANAKTFNAFSFTVGLRLERQ